MPRFHHPNPLDLLFFAADAASRRLGLPEATIQLVLELDGRLDVPRIRQAVAAVQRAYPVLRASCEISAWTGRPRWRLYPKQGSAAEPVQVHDASPSVDAPVTDILERFLARPRPALPLELRVYQGRSGGDLVLVRWPHALMDGRSGYSIVEDIDRLFHEPAALAERVCAGDEYAERLLPGSLRERIRAALRALSRPAGSTPRFAHLASGPIPANLGRLRCITRPLTPDQIVRARQRAEQLCGPGNLGLYLRACGLRALHQTMPRAVPGDALYTVLNVLDNRRKRQHAAVCRNLTSSLSLTVPAAVVMDRRHVGRMLRQQMRAHVRARSMTQIASLLWLLTRLPTAWLGAAVYSNLRPGRCAEPRLGAIPPPSLPIGLVPPFVRPMRTFCGVGLRNYYGCRPAVPDTGFAIDANLTPERLNLTGVCYENRVDVQTLTALVDRMVTALLE